MSYCRNCGAELPAGTRFCPTCGMAVENEPVRTQAPQPQTYPQPQPGYQQTPLQYQQNQAGYQPYGSQMYNVPPVYVQVTPVQPVLPQKKPGSIVRLVLGIITLFLSVYCVLLFLMSGGTFGFAAAFLMFPAGIIMIASRRGIAGGIVAAVLLFLAAFFLISARAYFETYLPDYNTPLLNDMIAKMFGIGIITLSFGVVSLVVSIVWGGRGKRI